MYGGPRVDRADGAFCTIRLFRKNRLFCFKITNGTRTVVAATVYTRWRNWQSRQSSTWSAEVVRWPEWCTWWAQSIQSTAALATASWRCTPDSSCIDTNTDNSNHAMLILLRCLSISSAKVHYFEWLCKKKHKKSPPKTDGDFFMSLYINLGVVETRLFTWSKNDKNGING